MVDGALVLAAGLFALTAGSNDGSAILAAGMHLPGWRPLGRLLALVTAVMIGPRLLFGTGVATTLARGLVPVSSHNSAHALVLAMLVAVSSALAVVFVLARRGLPTSLTLALVGGVAGAGVGTGLGMSGPELVDVLLVGIAAPLVCAGLAFVTARVGLSALGRGTAPGRARRLHECTFLMTCLAYSANGGQKMLAVFAVAFSLASGRAVYDPWWLTAVMAVLFGTGALLGLRPVSGTIGRKVLNVHLRHAIVAEACSAAVVMSVGLAGVPLTMSQSVAGALVGAGVNEGAGRVRWPVAARLVGAWGATLPVAVALSVLVGALASRL